MIGTRPIDLHLKGMRELGALISAHVLRGLKIVPVEHMDEVLGAALALDDVPGFLRAGDHIIDSIFEGAAAAAAGIAAGTAPPGVN